MSLLYKFCTQKDKRSRRMSLVFNKVKGDVQIFFFLRKLKKNNCSTFSMKAGKSYCHIVTVPSSFTSANQDFSQVLCKCLIIFLQNIGGCFFFLKKSGLLNFLFFSFNYILFFYKIWIDRLQATNFIYFANEFWLIWHLLCCCKKKKGGVIGSKPWDVWCNLSITEIKRKKLSCTYPLGCDDLSFSYHLFVSS